MKGAERRGCQHAQCKRRIEKERTWEEEGLDGELEVGWRSEPWTKEKERPPVSAEGANEEPEAG
jgi:hypothetical protein